MVPRPAQVRERRRAVVDRLLEAGVPLTVLQALLPGWEDIIPRAGGRQVVDSRD